MVFSLKPVAFPHRYCTVSDRFTATLERAVSPLPHLRYPNAADFQQAFLGSHPTPPPFLAPPPTFPPTPTQTSPSASQTNSWQWPFIGGAGATLVILAAVGLNHLQALKATETVRSEPSLSSNQTSETFPTPAPTVAPKPAPYDFH